MPIEVRLDSKYDPDHGWYFPKGSITIRRTESMWDFVSLDIAEARSLAYQLGLVIAQYDQKKGE